MYHHPLLSHFLISPLPMHSTAVSKQSQVHELKQAQTAEGSQLHRMLIDPAVNLVFKRMKTQLSDYKEKLEQAQSDLSAWKFTPDRLADLSSPSLSLYCVIVILPKLMCSLFQFHCRVF